MVHQPYGLPTLPLHYPSEANGPKPHFPERDSSRQTPNGDTNPLDLILSQTTERLHRAADLIADDGIRSPQDLRSECRRLYLRNARVASFAPDE